MVMKRMMFQGYFYLYLADFIDVLLTLNIAYPSLYALDLSIFNSFK